MPNIPKAVLYYSPISVWSAVVLLALEEKGYSPDEVDSRIVDLQKGENLDPTFLRLNPKATVPVLVVPYENSLRDDDGHYKALTDTKIIVEFLDKSRSMLSHTHSISTAPAPSLTPATIAALNSCQLIIGEILHSNEANPDTLRYLNARNDASLATVAKDTISTLKQRQQTLVKHLSQVENREIQVSEKVKKLWSERLDATNVILTVLVDADKAESELDEGAKANRHAFFKTARQAWEVNLGGILVQLSKEMAGPYSLGDQFSIADLHLAGWLSRVVSLCGGNINDDGSTVVMKIEDHIGGVKLARDFVAEPAREKGEKQSKIGVFWDAMRERPSFKKIYKEGLY